MKVILTLHGFKIAEVALDLDKLPEEARREVFARGSQLQVYVQVDNDVVSTGGVSVPPRKS